MKKTIMTCSVLVIILAMLSGCAIIRNLIPGRNTPEPQQTGPTLVVSEIPASPSTEPTPSASQNETAAPITEIVTVTPEKYEYRSDYIETTIEVPQLTGLSDMTVQDSINKVFIDIMTAARSDVKPAEEESRKYAEEGMTSGAPYMIYLSFSIPYNKDGVLSILVSDYRYLGGAHGGELWSAYTFDLRTGEELSLSDLMVEGSVYNDMINDKIRKEIDKRTQEGALAEIIPFENIGDDPAYYLTADAIIFFFQEYEYFPYAAGIQEFPIKYEAFNGMLKKM